MMNENELIDENDNQNENENENVDMRNGRGLAKGAKGWGELGYKMELSFDDQWLVVGPNADMFSSRLGLLAKCGARLPLIPQSWRKVNAQKKDAVWLEIQTYTNAPDQFRKVCMKRLSELWKRWKAEVKKTFFTPYKNDPIRLLTPPDDSRLRGSDWIKMVQYWQREDVQLEAARNKRNRAQLEFNHRSGRKSFAQIRHEMGLRGENTSRLSVFLKSRCGKNGQVSEDVQAVVSQMTTRLSEIPESERTTAVEDQIFMDIMGPEGHGRVRTYGTGPTPTDIFGSRSSCTGLQNGYDERIQRIVQKELDARVEKEISARIAEQERRRDQDIAAAVQRQLEAHGIIRASHQDGASGSALNEDYLQEDM